MSPSPDIFPDLSALTRSVSAREVAEHQRTWSIRNEVAGMSIEYRAIALAMTFIGISAIVSILSLSEQLAGRSPEYLSGVPWALAHVVIPLLIGALVTVLFAIALAVGNRRESETSLRLWQFAQDNGLAYEKRAPAPDYESVQFHLGQRRAVHNQVTAVDQDYFELGNIRSLLSTSKYHENTVTTGYLAILLDRHMPHMILDSKANNKLGVVNAIGRFTYLRRLSLEGDFDKYFTLYCAEGHERDALYVFTPDLMAIAIDNAAPFDIEIIDEWMFVFVHGGLPVFHPRAFRRLFTVMDTLAAKALRRRGERSEVQRPISPRLPRVLAARTRRVVNGLWIAAALIALIAAACAIWLLPQFMGGN